MPLDIKLRHEYELLQLISAKSHSTIVGSEILN